MVRRVANASSGLDDNEAPCPVMGSIATEMGGRRDVRFTLHSDRRAELRGMSQTCHLRTHAPQQSVSLLDLVGAGEHGGGMVKPTVVSAST